MEPGSEDSGQSILFQDAFPRFAESVFGTPLSPRPFLPGSGRASVPEGSRPNIADLLQTGSLIVKSMSESGDRSLKTVVTLYFDETIARHNPPPAVLPVDASHRLSPGEGKEVGDRVLAASLTSIFIDS